MEKRTYARRECACNNCLNNVVPRPFHATAGTANCVCQKKLNASLIELVGYNNQKQCQSHHDDKPKKVKPSTTIAKATLITVSKKSLEKLIEIHVKDKIDSAVQASVNKITSDIQHRITLQESRLIKLESSIISLRNNVYKLNLTNNSQNSNNINKLFPTVESSRLPASAPSKAFQSGFDEFKLAVLEAIKGVDKKHQSNYDESKSVLQAMQNQMKYQTSNTTYSKRNNLANMREQSAFLNEQGSDWMKDSSINSLNNTNNANPNGATSVEQQELESDFKNAIVKELRRQSEINQGIETTLQFHDNDIKLLKELTSNLQDALEDFTGVSLPFTRLTHTTLPTSSDDKPTSSSSKPRNEKEVETSSSTMENKYKSLKSKLRTIGDSTSQACQTMANRLDSIENSTLSLLSFAERSSEAFRILSDELNFDESVVPKLYGSTITTETSTKAAADKKKSSNIINNQQPSEEDKSQDIGSEEYGGDNESTL